MQKNIVDNRKLLEYLGANEEDFPATATHARYAVIDDTLETLLDADWSGWTVEHQRVINSGLATGKKNALVYLIAARQITSRPPQFLQGLLKKAHLLVG